ncbi:hypothetical protein NC652_035053 [Populus alba x Populus x berolinensis]|uniref:Uncharacterized protein n=1 Tax=Populus alba x Populus x berolinensis TaxID=444605 RepID=A0AAD6LNV6_9ROSI|nr:hypothetical protein NC651_033911 [Populus alba x Populus x berolinensis]KAJ6875532.1 hypothetical protein NC652_035053 [Populus alba x Populus x berolinensis]KAJ6970534.1 hypothetical protein NC653_034968 [Populus alba x Populus x berolinensis]
MLAFLVQMAAQKVALQKYLLHGIQS